MTLPHGMTNHAASIASLGSDHMAQYHMMAEVERAARADKSLIGRFYRRQVADGQANYEVCWIKGKKAFLRHLRIADGHHHSELESLASEVRDPAAPQSALFVVDVSLVKDNIALQDRIATHFLGPT